MRWGVWSVLYKHGCVAELGKGTDEEDEGNEGELVQSFIYIYGPICIIPKLKGLICKLKLKLGWIRLPCLGRVWRSESGRES